MGAIQDFTDYVTTSSHWWGPRGIFHRSVEHMRLSAASVVAAASSRFDRDVLRDVKRGGFIAQSIVNIGRQCLRLRSCLAFPIAGVRLRPRVLGRRSSLCCWPFRRCSQHVHRRARRRPRDRGTSKGMDGWRSAAVARGVPDCAPADPHGVRVASVQVVATATLARSSGSTDSVRTSTRVSANRMMAALTGAVAWRARDPYRGALLIDRAMVHTMGVADWPAASGARCCPLRCCPYERSTQ